MYTIKVLQNKEFDRLPYKKVATSLGVADPKINTAYVRYTGIDQLDKYLIDHEFEHLIEETPTDEFEGVRYKDLGSMFSGAAGKVGSAAKGVGNWFKQPGQAIPYSSQGQFYQPLSSLSKTAGMKPTESATGGNFLSSMFKNPQTMLGLGMTGLSMLKQTPKVPDISSQTSAFRNFANQGSAVGNQAQGVLGSMLSEPIDKLTDQETESILYPIREEKKKQLKYLQDVYRNVRPGSDPTTDTTFLKDMTDMENQYAETEARAVQNALTGKRGQRINEVSAARGWDQQQSALLAQLAQMDVDQIMAQYQVDYTDAMTLKNLALSSGFNLLSSAAGYSPMSMFPMALGGK